MSVPTLVQVRSHSGPDDEEAELVVGASVVTGAEEPHQPS